MHLWCIYACQYFVYILSRKKIASSKVNMPAEYTWSCSIRRSFLRSWPSLFSFVLFYPNPTMTGFSLSLRDLDLKEIFFRWKKWLEVPNASVYTWSEPILKTQWILPNRSRYVMLSFLTFKTCMISLCVFQSNVQATMC